MNMSLQRGGSELAARSARNAELSRFSRAKWYLLCLAFLGLFLFASGAPVYSQDPPDPPPEEEVPPEEEEEEEENAAPAIEEFLTAYDDINDEWYFSGFVDDEDPDSCTVEFGGLLEGYEAEVDENGFFELVLDLDGEEGLVTVEAMDEEGAVSEEEWDDIIDF